MYLRALSSTFDPSCIFFLLVIIIATISRGDADTRACSQNDSSARFSPAPLHVWSLVTGLHGCCSQHSSIRAGITRLS